MRRIKFIYPKTVRGVVQKAGTTAEVSVGEAATLIAHGYGVPAGDADNKAGADKAGAGQRPANRKDGK